MVEYSRGAVRADDGAVRGYHPHLQLALPDGDGPCGQGRSGDRQDAPPEYCRWCLPPRTPHCEPSTVPGLESVTLMLKVMSFTMV
eukprot:8920721-Pyramimonas_sp.AAC.2